jgi:hypothetical protein
MPLSEFEIIAVSNYNATGKRWYDRLQNRMVMTRLPFVLVLTALVPALIPGQQAGNESQMKRYALFSRALPSLADAHLSRQDRAVIYRAIDDKITRGTYSGSPDEERATILSCKVGHIVLAQDGSPQIVVTGPESSCGSGGCSIRIFVRQNGRLRLALSSNADTISIKKAATKGFHDIATHWHWGYLSGRYATYRWTGSEYKRISCYDTKPDKDQETRTLTSCEPEPNR